LEINSFNASTADLWDIMNKAIVIDDEMYRLENAKKVSIEQEY